MNLCVKLFLCGISTGSKDCGKVDTDVCFFSFEALPGLAYILLFVLILFIPRCRGVCE